MSPLRRRWRLALTLVGALLALLLALAPLSRSPRQRSSPGAAAPLPAAAYPADTLPLQVSIHVKNLYNLQIDNQTFSADGWYALQWDQRLEDLMRSSGISSDRLVAFDNQIDLADGAIEAETAEPRLNADGTSTQMFRFSARFYIDRLDLHNSPFDKLVLPSRSASSRRQISGAWWATMAMWRAMSYADPPCRAASTFTRALPARSPSPSASWRCG